MPGRPTAVLCLLVGVAFILLLAGCKGAHGPVVGSLLFVESHPAEAGLDLPGVPDAPEVWPGVFAGADSLIDVASFYFSRQGDGEGEQTPAGAPDRLLPVLAELEAAAERGLPVRMLSDRGFYRTYPQVIDEFADLPGVQTLTLDARGIWGGALHAKYFIADETLYIGSQNWDWRALDHIHELGALIEHPVLAAQLRTLFELDWGLATGATAAIAPPSSEFSAKLVEQPTVPLRTAAGDTVQAFLAASPAATLTAGMAWDLPLLVELIDAAQDSLSMQLLSYSVTGRDGEAFDDLDQALRRAATRGVRVRMVLANWSKARSRLHAIQNLAALPNLEIRFTNIPEFSGGFIPYARVDHAKFVTVDGRLCWLGTANWGSGYFDDSRNVSLFLQGQGATTVADRFFQQSWHSPYAETVDPQGEYQPPRRQ